MELDEVADPVAKGSIMLMIIKNNNNIDKVPSGFKLCVDICLK